MARLIRHGSSRGWRAGNAKDLTKRPIKTFIIYASDLVQIIAKVKSMQHLLLHVNKIFADLIDTFMSAQDVPLGREFLQNGKSRENRAEIVTDSFLSLGRHGDIERELKPWTPDQEDPKDLELESTFQNTWNR
jgi:hypothetical protein